MTVNTFTQYDMARSILNGLAYSGSNIPYKCHINKINNRALFFGFTDGLKEHLDCLETLGEAYNAGAGYWSTSPTRNVSIGKFWLIISSLPTIHFPRTIECKGNIGIGRVSETPFPNVDTQDLHDWMRVPGTLEAWITSILNLAKENLAPSTLRPDDHEFFLPCNDGNPNRFWNPSSKISQSYSEVILIRSLTQAPRHYFWGKLDGKSLLESRFPVNLEDIFRLRLAIEMLHGYSRTAYVITNNKQVELKVNFELPRQEERLLLAIGNKSQEANIRRYIFSSDFESVVEFELTKLGINFRRN